MAGIGRGKRSGDLESHGPAEAGSFMHGALLSVNNCLSTLSMMLKMAVKWKVIDRMPVEIEHLKGADSTRYH
jgi:hypothetical protein